jgi:hypothetical protein
VTLTAQELKRPRLAVTLTFITNGIVGGSLVSRIPDYKARLHISNSTLGTSLFFASLECSSPWDPLVASLQNMEAAELLSMLRSP